MIPPAEPPEAPGATEEPAPAPGRPGASTFTIEGRQAPALFVIGWFGALSGGALIVIGLLSGGGLPASVLFLAGMLALAIGLIAAAGSQGIERRARGGLAYAGPSPVLVFATSVPVSLLIVILVGIPLAIVGVAVDGPIGRLASVAVQALVYIGLIRLLVVDPGALSWADMGIRRPDGHALRDLATGAAWALPVIAMTIPIAAVLGAIFPVTPVSPLPPAGETGGFIVNLVAGAIIAPVGEEILFRGFATTAWARALSPSRALVRGALFFAIVHVLTISGGSAPEALALAIIGFATRVPVAVVLGWLFLRRGSIWAPIGLHAAFNGTLLVLGEAAARSGLT